MPNLSVTAKGQITLRKDVLRHLGVAAGSKVTVNTLPGGRVEIVAQKPGGKIADMFGLLSRERQAPLSIEAMNEAIAKGWAGER